MIGCTIAGVEHETSQKWWNRFVETGKQAGRQTETDSQIDRQNLFLTCQYLVAWENPILIWGHEVKKKLKIESV